jgi:transcriptional regulator with XRE-family HTH domain
MSENEYKKIFSKNLRYYMNKNNKKQSDLINDLGFSSSTISNWCTGEKLPRMDKVQILADYFHINKSDLLEDKSNSNEEETYYLNDDARDMAQFMYENPEYKVLFDASRKVKKEDIDFVKQMIDRMSNKGDD